MTYSEALKKVKGQTLTFEKTIKLTEDDKLINIINYRHYNKIQIVRPETLGKLGEMPHIATFMMRNLFLNDNDRERIMSLIKKHSTIGDWTVLLFCLDKSVKIVD